jgi:hypothetical protein
MKLWFAIPPVLVTFGTVWIAMAVSHYERVTGRQFYGLAGHHRSWPTEGFSYLPGGEVIERWTIDIPVGVTAGLLIAFGLVFTALHRQRGIRPIALWWLTAVGCSVVFLLAASWVSININGVFI